MIDKYRLHNVAGNGSAKNKTYRMKEIGDELAPRDCTYPLDGPGKHAKSKATKEAKK